MTATPDTIPSDLTLEIGDDLSPDRFVAAIRAFFGYVKEISDTTSNADTDVAWKVHVKEGSALIGMIPTKAVPGPVIEAVYAKVSAGIDHIRNGDIEGSNLPEAALKHLRSLSEMSEAEKRKPVEMRIWVKRKPIVMGADIGRAIAEDWRSDYSDFGTVEGRLDTIQDRGSLQIFVRDPLYTGSIRCHFDEELLPKAFENFRKRVEISGTIHYRKNGKPISIEVANIEGLPDDSELPTAEDIRGLFETTA
ncbi:MAG TPA: hypothetical protein VHC39_12420 [Rhizomicrobium sp.]|nr:hypothetical protein [Rhizomicrobium sp.]